MASIGLGRVPKFQRRHLNDIALGKIIQNNKEFNIYILSVYHHEDCKPETEVKNFYEQLQSSLKEKADYKFSGKKP